MIRRLNFLWLTILLLAVAGCGETKTVTTTATSTTTAAAATTTTTTATVTTALRATTAVSCQPGVSFAGCSVTAEAAPLTPGRLSLTLAPPIHGPQFPDVSSWQGHPGWGQVFAWQRSHGWPTGGFFKLGEYHVDPSAAFNAAALKGHFNAGYWFVRNTGCAHEAGLIIATARQFGVHFVWLDIEVPEARGYAPCLLPQVRNAGLGAGVYTGPGTWTGDSIPSTTPLWDAAYNFHGPSTAGLWTSHTDCWQFTDGTFASRTFVPGIGYDDVNVDFNCIKLVGGGTSRPPNPLAVLDHTVRHFRHGVTASEYNTVRTWRARGCRRPIRRRVCVTSHYHAQLLRGRLQSVLAFGHHGHGFDHVYKRLALLGSVSE